MGYKKTAVTGVSWVSAFRFSYRGITLIRTAVLARLLTPTQFGDFGVAAIILALTEMLTETGINVFFVQNNQKNSLATYLHTAWSISIIRGAIIATAILASAHLVSSFFNAPGAYPIILVISLVPIIRGFINPAIIQFQKNLEFNKEFVIRLFITIADALVAITIALIFKTPLALAIGLIMGAITEVIISHLFVRPKPHFHFNVSQAKTIIHEGKWVTAAGISSYLANKAPDISIGKLLSSYSLGIYQMAYKWSLMLVDELFEMINRVAFPVYAKIATDTSRLKKAFFKTYALCVGLNTAAMAIIYIAAGPFVSIILGPNWDLVIPLLKQLSLVGVMIGLAAPTNPLFLAVKKQRYLSAVVILQLAAVIISLVILGLQAPHISSIILAFGISIAATLPLRWLYAYKILKN
jgi:O-antigen/teichoic acid export membrane protein